MARIIKYYERGEWKYATVKDIGEISNLMTTNKTDIVSAINEIFTQGGGGSIPPDLEQKIQQLETITQEHTGSIDSIYTDLGVVDGEITAITTQQSSDTQKIQTLTLEAEAIQEELNQAKNDLLNNAEKAYVDVELATRVTATELSTELAQKAGVSYVDAELAKKLSESKYQEDYLATKAQIDNKLDLTSYQTDYDAIVADISSKVDVTAFNGVEGRVTSAESSITNINNELEQKVSSLDYESDVGINKWLVTRYTGVLSDMAQYNPEHSMIQDASEQETIELLDGATISPEASNASIYRLFTNVYTAQAKTIGLTLSYQDSIHVLMNGASIYKNKSNAGAGITASLSLRRGWNTVEILLGNKDGQPSINFSTILSDMVDKMTTVIGVGDRNEFRLKQAETSIKQNSDEIALRATKTEVSNLGNRVSDAESELTVQAGQIASKVSQTEFDGYSQRLGKAESTITQQANQIASKVSQTDYNLLNGKVNEQETEINQMSGEIALKASQSSVDALSGEVDDVQSSLTIQAGQIATKVESSTLTTELAKKEGSITKSATAPSNPYTNQMWLDTSGSISILKTWTGTAWKKATPTSAGEVGAYTKSETDSKTATALGDAKTYADGKVAPVLTRLTDAETGITQNQDEIALRATKQEVDVIKTDVGNVVTRVSNAETAIEQNSDEIALRATKTELNGLTGEVNTVKSQLSVQAGQIATKVEGTTLTTELAKKEGTIHKSNTAPSSPYTGQLWMDTSTSLNQLKRWTGSSWAKATPTSAGEVGAYTKSETDTKTSSALSDAKTYADGKVAPVLTRLSTAESNITQTQNDINLKASKTDVYTKSETDGKVGTKADQTALDSTNSNLSSLTTRVTNAEADINVNAEQIALRATKTEFNNLSGRVSSAESQLTVQAGQISSKVSQSDFNNLSIGGRNLVPNTKDLSGYLYRTEDTYLDFNVAKQTRTSSTGYVDVLSGYTIDVAEGDSFVLSFYAKSDASRTVVCHFYSPNTTTRAESSTGQVTTAPDGGVGVSVSTEWQRYWVKWEQSETTERKRFIVGRLSGVGTLEIAGVKLEKGNKATDWTPAPEDVQGQLDSQGQRLSTAESSITQQAGEIASKVATTTFNSLAGRVSTAESTITQHSNQIASKVSTTDFNSLTGRVSTAESTITQHSSAINLRVEKNKVVSEINQSPESIKISASKIDIQGAVTFSSFDSTTQSKINGIESTANTANTTASTAKSTADTAKSTADTAKSTADSANSTANTAKSTADTAIGEATTAIEVAKAMAGGSLVREDVKFESGTNGVGTYNNANNGAVNVYRVANPSDSPTTSTHALKIVHTGSGSPSLGGIVQNISSRANAKFVVRYIIKLPTGYKLNTASNSMGSGYKDGFVGNDMGTGKYSEYIRVVECGSSGTFSSGGHVYVSGATPSSSNPLEWYLASIEQYDVTDWQPVPSSVSSSITSAQSTANTAVSTANTAKSTADSAKSTADTASSNATTALSRTNDMFDDLKVTPPEKQELKRLWDSIKLEYTQIIAMATSLAVSATNYTSAFNALNTTAPRIETDVLASMTTTYSFGTTTNRDAFNTQLTNYFTQREALRKALSDKQKSIADGAQSTATSANTLAGTANSTANTAKGKTDELYSDLKITPLEKQELKRLWDAIKLEYTQNLAMGTALSVDTSSYTTAYNALNGTAPRIETDVLANMTTTYDLVNTTNRDLFRNQMNAYVTQREALKKDLTDKQKSLTTTAQGTANTANSTANTVKTLTDGWKHTSDTTKIDGGKIFTNSVTANQINVTSLSALTANLGTVTTGQIKGVSFESPVTETQDPTGRWWREWVQIGVGGNTFRTTSERNVSVNGGDMLVSETVIGSDGVTTFLVDDESFASTAVTMNGYGLVFAGTTGTTPFRIYSDNRMEITVASGRLDFLLNEGSRFYQNGESIRLVGDNHSYITFYNGSTRQGWIGQGSSDSSNLDIRAEKGHLTLQSRTGNIYLQSDVIATSKVSGRLAHTNGYLEVQSFSSGYGNGQAELWYRADQRQLTVASRNSGDSGSSPVNLYVDTLISDNIQTSSTSNYGYLQAGSSREWRVTQTGSTSTYRPIRASSFPTGSSIRFKDNLEKFEYDYARYLVEDTEVFKYHLKSNLEGRIYDKPKIGLIAEMIPSELRDEDGVDTYSMVSTLWAVVQGQINQIEALQNEVALLRNEMYAIDQENDAQFDLLKEEVESIKASLAS